MSKNEEPSNRPKRVLSPFFRFTADERKREGKQEKTSVSANATRYAEKWNAFGPEEKKGYEEEYQKDLEKYRAAMEEYKKTDEYKEFVKSKKRSGKDHKPKKPRNVSPYNVFMAEMYEKRKEETGAFNFKEVASEASQIWKTMGEQNKEVYQKKADERNKARREKQESMA